MIFRLRQVIGAVLIVWALANSLGTLPQFLHLLFNAPTSYWMAASMPLLISMIGGLVGGARYLQSQRWALPLIIPFLLYQALSGLARYQHVADTTPHRADLALLTVALAGVLLLALIADQWWRRAHHDTE